MSAPAQTTTPAPNTPTVQLSLPGADEMFAAAGLESLPQGAGELGPKQLRFCIEFLNCGIATDAAERAGYSRESAEKVRKTPAVARFLNAAVKVVAQNGDQLVRRKFELSVAYHAELVELRKTPLKDRTEREIRREQSVALMAVRNDTLLAAMLNRLGVKLTGEVAVATTPGGGGDFMVLPPDALAGFAAARAEVAAVNRLEAARKN